MSRYYESNNIARILDAIKYDREHLESLRQDLDDFEKIIQSLKNDGYIEGDKLFLGPSLKLTKKGEMYLESLKIKK